MVVLRDHKVAVSKETKDHLIDVLTRTAATYFATMEFYIDEHMRQIPNHLHVHARVRVDPWWRREPTS